MSDQYESRRRFIVAQLKGEFQPKLGFPVGSYEGQLLTILLEAAFDMGAGQRHTDRMPITKERITKAEAEHVARLERRRTPQSVTLPGGDTVTKWSEKLDLRGVPSAPAAYTPLLYSVQCACGWSGPTPAMKDLPNDGGAVECCPQCGSESLEEVTVPVL